ncbi:MAG: xanthine dehydrogenase family protein subunit M [Clostridiales bacterium]|nr:xanthine dehydrogenase family protein subunit M [Clostridiales bacterium]
MILNACPYEKPTTLQRLLELNQTPGAKLLAGGTDLVLVMKENKAEPALLIDIKNVPELHGIYAIPGGIFIGAAEPIQEVVEHPLTQVYHALVEGAGRIGCYEIRLRATIGGNICNGSPSADSVPGLLLYDADVVVAGRSGTRVSTLESFLLGPGRVDLQEGEVLLGVNLKTPNPNAKSKYYRCSRVKGMDLSGISAGIYCEGKSNFRIAFGAAWPTVARAKAAEEILNAGPYTPERLQQAIAATLETVHPRRSSMRASPEYKRAMVGELIQMGIEELTGGACNG